MTWPDDQWLILLCEMTEWYGIINGNGGNIQTLWRTEELMVLIQYSSVFEKWQRGQWH